jgi:hypothetical protein
MTKHLASPKRPRPSGRIRRRPKGWTPERRARQAESIRLSQPWRHSTGPRTEAGKARVAMNSLRHGCRSRAWILKARRIRNAIRLCACTVLLARALKQQQALASRITPAAKAALIAEAVPFFSSPVYGEGGRRSEGERLHPHTGNTVGGALGV